MIMMLIMIIMMIILLDIMGVVVVEEIVVIRSGVVDFSEVDDSDGGIILCGIVLLIVKL